MNRLAIGDVDALRPLYLQYGGVVARVLRRQLPELPGEELEELTQEVFLTLTETAARYDHQDRLQGWIVGIAVRLGRNRARTRRSRIQRLREVPPSPEPAGPASQIDARQRLDIAMGSLTEGEREVLLLQVVEGLSGEQIAEALGTTPGAIYTRLHRARRRVAAALREADGEVS